MRLAASIVEASQPEIDDVIARIERGIDDGGELLDQANSYFARRANDSANLQWGVLHHAASSPHVELRTWAAIALSDALRLSPPEYAQLASTLIDDPDPAVVEAAIDSVVWMEPRLDLSWSQLQPIVRTILLRHQH